jgi:hypothetical protein
VTAGMLAVGVPAKVVGHAPDLNEDGDPWPT